MATYQEAIAEQAMLRSTVPVKGVPIDDVPSLAKKPDGKWQVVWGCLCVTGENCPCDTIIWIPTEAIAARSDTGEEAAHGRGTITEYRVQSSARLLVQSMAEIPAGSYRSSVTAVAQANDGGGGLDNSDCAIKYGNDFIDCSLNYPDDAIRRGNCEANALAVYRICKWISSFQVTDSSSAAILNVLSRLAR